MSDPKENAAGAEQQKSLPEGAKAQSTPPAASIGPGGGVNPVAPIMDAEEAADSGPLDLYTVMVDRDANTRIPQQVLGYEVPVILEIYGEDRVFVIESEEIDTSDFDVERAYDGLRTKYRKYGDQLKAVYGSMAQFARVVGVKAPGGSTAASRDKRSLQKVRKPAPKKAAAKR